MTDTSNFRYLYRRQPETGLWIEEHGPFGSPEEAEIARHAAPDANGLVVGICTSEDGRTVVTQYPGEGPQVVTVPRPMGGGAAWDQFAADYKSRGLAK